MMGRKRMEVLLQEALAPELHLKSDLLTHLASVVVDLSPQELADEPMLDALLEPFLLDALKSGRQSPHDSHKSEKLVKVLCKRVRLQLAPDAPAASPGGDAVDKRHMEGGTAQTESIAKIKEALLAALASVSNAICLHDAVIAQLTQALLEQADEDRNNLELLQRLLDQPLRDAFHESGDWPADEDAAYVKQFCEALQVALASAK